ncbi:hypothetical protein GCM10010435_06250 [Winogradskya consettensis]|uniref:Uncharacterized protein n=1 Tax=Winogradskya consettensis TaxID=113560 RepID=A0A919SVH6_9ACTN|nr:hypothetical protein Aco04nite_65120 [Actinoplanes consettensis]
MGTATSFLISYATALVGSPSARSAAAPATLLNIVMLRLYFVSVTGHTPGL